MTETELMGRAAKAAGYELDDEWNTPLSGILIITAGGRDLWEPLDEDADAFRLAAQLSLKVEFLGWRIVVENWRGEKVIERCKSTSPTQEDFLQAGRRAIVRAAAEFYKNTSA